VFNGDTLLATVDQQTASGVATGTAKTRHVQPDHLGSTNVVTDENDNVVRTLDYYPYGATRVSYPTWNLDRDKYRFDGIATTRGTGIELNGLDSTRNDNRKLKEVFKRWGIRAVMARCLVFVALGAATRI
jgi:uncharacterized protein RhaS with RHS repeats